MSATSTLMDAFWAAPPISRTITAATVVLSVCVWFGLLGAYYVVFIPRSIFQLWIPQLWRFVTPFLITGPKLGLIMDPYFLFTYSKALETDSARFSQPGDYVVFLAFACSIILLTGGLILNGFIFLPALTLAIAYMYAQENPNARMNFFIVTFRVKYLPYCMLLFTFIADSPQSALMQSMGLVAGHLYDFLTRIWPAFGGGSNPVRTPQFVHRLFVKPPGAANTRAYGTAFEARNRTQPSAAAPRAGGWASGFNSGSWGGRGPGRRLGGE
ncbi:hypothetical protein MBLNU459_g5374t1 [Dothideomycetes sp. NU459]